PRSGSHLLKFLTAFADEDAFLSFALAVNGGSDLGEPVRLFVALNQHSGRVGNLLGRFQKHFFADDLRGDEAFRLVRDLVFREIARPVRQGSHDLFHQNIEPLPLGRGDWNNLAKFVQLAISLDDGQQFFFLQFVDFVEQQHGRAARSPDEIENMLVSRPELFRCVHDHQDQVAAFQRGMNFLHHLAVEPAVRSVDAGRINQDDLSRRTPALRLNVDYALNAGARGLRLFRHNGDLFADQSVQQRAFAGVRPADDGNESGAEGHATWRPLGPGPQAAPGSRALSLLFVPWTPEFQSAGHRLQ